VTGLKFGKREASFFEDLVWFNQAETMDEKNSWFQKMQNELKIVRFTQGQHQLAFYQYQVYSHWRHLVVRSLIGMYGFTGDFASLAKSVHPAITVDEAKESVELLEKCNLIEKKEDGSYVLVSKDITTGDRTSKIALRGFHQRCLALGAESIDRDPPTMRNISGLTLGISQAGYEKIVERMSAFRKEIAQIADEDKDADKVYQMQLLLFPIGGKL
ncbi:MAG: TIGR02147 family protein, partial [Fibrobacter sp.]|nr:TIGR02147 family protein [Fibrobacter sp.]